MRSAACHVTRSIASSHLRYAPVLATLALRYATGVTVRREVAECKVDSDGRNGSNSGERRLLPSLHSSLTCRLSLSLPFLHFSLASLARFTLISALLPSYHRHPAFGGPFG